MITIDHHILGLAFSLIEKHFGNLDDLPEGLQNTIVNTYYKYCYLKKETSGEFASPEIVARAKDLEEGFNEFVEEFASVSAAVETLPKMIGALRTFQGPEAYEAAVLVMEAIFKSKIPDAGNYAPADLERRIKFLESSNDEIPGLWKLAYNPRRDYVSDDLIPAWRMRKRDVIAEAGGLYFFPFDQDRKKLFAYYLEGYNLGAQEAAFELGKLYDGITNPNSLRKLLVQTGMAFSPEKVKEYDTNYFDGKIEAAKWFEKGAILGDPMAQYELGQKYIKGEGIKKSRSEGIKWIKLAAAQGHKNAQSYTDHWLFKWLR